MTSDKRWQQRFASFSKALNNLSEGVTQKHYNQLEQTGLIQMFNIAFELAWKTLKDLLINEGFLINSPRETIKQAFQAGYIVNGEMWLDALEKRNMMVHIYDEDKNTEVLQLIINNYSPLLTALHSTLARKITP